jgi:hypothetical protein
LAQAHCIKDSVLLDPACGSGSFLLASLRYLTNALYDSILAHHRLENQDLRNIQDIISGEPSEDVLSTEQLPCRPEDDDFEPRFKAILRRHVVENCIYGVDLDAVAVMPVSLRTLWMSLIVNSWAVRPYIRRYCVASMNTSSME